MKTSTGAIVHLVGEQITFDERSRQRCLWCGALVEERDWKLTAIAIPAGKSEQETVEEARARKWEGFVGVDGNMTYRVEHDSDKVPEGSCMLLDPEVTK